MKRGFTLLETLIVLSIAGLLLAIAFPRAAGWLDRVAVSSVANELIMFYHRARFASMLRGTRVRVEFGERELSATYEAIVDSTFLVRPGPERRGVELRVSRRIVRIRPNGLGWGAANTKLVVWRREAAESLTISREGRLKRWR